MIAKRGHSLQVINGSDRTVEKERVIASGATAFCAPRLGLGQSPGPRPHSTKPYAWRESDNLHYNTANPNRVSLLFQVLNLHIQLSLGHLYHVS